MKRKIIALCFFFCCFQFACMRAARAQRLENSHAPGLEELIDSALHKNYELANKQLDVALTEVDRQKLKDAFLPRVSVSAKDAFSLTSISVKSRELLIPSLNIDLKTDNNRFTMTSNMLATGADVSMLLYSGGKVAQLKKALEHKSAAQKLIMEQDRQQITSNILEAYDQLALLKQVKKVLDEAAIRLAENKKTADKALAYGLTTRYEHQKIEVAQAQLASKIVAYTGKRELVLEQLFLLTDIERERLEAIDNPLQLIQVAQQLDGIENRAEIKSLDAAIRAGEYKVRAEKTWFVPKVGLSGSVGYLGSFGTHISSSKPVLPNGDKLSSSPPTLQIFPMLSVGIGVKWDLFDGRDGSHEVRRATLELKQTENDKRDATEKLELNLAKCRTDYSIALSQISFKTAQQQTAQNALTQATKEFRNGLVKSLQLIDAENDFEQAALDYIQGVYDQRRAAISLLMATGNLNLSAITH